MFRVQGARIFTPALPGFSRTSLTSQRFKARFQAIAERPPGNWNGLRVPLFRATPEVGSTEVIGSDWDRTAISGTEDASEGSGQGGHRETAGSRWTSQVRNTRTQVGRGNGQKHRCPNQGLGECCRSKNQRPDRHGFGGRNSQPRDGSRRREEDGITAVQGSPNLTLSTGIRRFRDHKIRGCPVGSASGSTAGNFLVRVRFRV